MFVSSQGNGVVATTSPSDDVTDEFTGGTYVRFGVPKDKIRRSWPGLRGNNHIYTCLSVCLYVSLYIYVYMYKYINICL